MARGIFATLILAATLFQTACPKKDVPPPETPGPLGISLLLSSTRPRPGDVVTIRVEADAPAIVGLDSALDRWMGEDWQFEFVLLKAWSNGSADYAPAGSRLAFPDVGLKGEKNWPIKIPVELLPGQYRIREEVSFGPDSGLPGLVELAVQLEIES